MAHPSRSACAAMLVLASALAWSLAGCVTEDLPRPPSRPAAPSSTAVASPTPTSPAPSPVTTGSGPPATLGPPPSGTTGSILGPSGTIVTTTWNESTIDVISVRPDGTPIGVIRVRRDPRWQSQEGPMSFVSPDGRLAADLCLRPAAECGWAIFDLHQPDQPPALIVAPGVTFLPTGTLVGLSNDRRELLRLRAPYDGAPIRTRIPAGVEIPDLNPLLSIAADGTGVYGLLEVALPDRDLAPWRRLVLVAWDGSMKIADPAVEPYQLLGTQRLVGAGGQSAFGWIRVPGVEGVRGLAIEGPSTPRLETDIQNPVGTWWMPGGRDLLILEGTTIEALAGRSTRVITPLPPLRNEFDIYGQVWALSPDVIVFHSTGMETWHVVSLATGQLLDLPGIVAGIVP